MATDRQAPGAARILKTERLHHVITSDEATASIVVLDVPFDNPFVDLNFTVSFSVEVIGSDNPPDSLSDDVSVYGFKKFLDKVTVAFDVGNLGADFEVVVHAIAIHD